MCSMILEARFNRWLILFWPDLASRFLWFILGLRTRTMSSGFRFRHLILPILRIRSEEARLRRHKETSRLASSLLCAVVWKKKIKHDYTSSATWGRDSICFFAIATWKNPWLKSRTRLEMWLMSPTEGEDKVLLAVGSFRSFSETSST